MRADKSQLVRDIQALLEPSSAVFLVSYKGLTAAAFGILRGALAGVGAECHVVPLRLLRRAAAAAGMADLADAEFAGDTAMVTGAGDPVAVARTLREFAKDNAALTFKLGFLDGKACTAAEAESLADLPKRDVLLAQLLGLLQAPASALVGVLNAKVASVVYVLSAYVSEKEKAA